ncbi:ABC transporter ATP-binding protein [Lutispora sp.]|uniref:ABC transporter ATP-binding protein n=1 Tax=Lutispora sp. TaxID=2828727 RepID=UPI002B1F8B55|nr:ABC transporter ATP-binding protein [Lutispora sp.]MEA4960167.1 ABC transporter ATP-binding protein [Lutispora sp.]
MVLICIVLSAGINIAEPYIGKLLIDEGLIKMNFNLSFKFALACFLLALMQQCISVLETKYTVYLNTMAPFYMHKAALKQLLKIKIEYYSNKNSSEIINNINMDINNINRVFEKSTIYGITQILGFVGGLIGLLIIDWRMTIVVLLVVPIRYVIIKYASEKRREYMQAQIELYREYSAWHGDVIEGVREIKLWGIYKEIYSEFTEKQRKIIRITMKVTFLDIVNSVSESIVFELLINSLYIIGSYFIIGGSLSVGALFSFITYSAFVTRPVSVLLNIWYSLSSIMPSAKRFFEFLDMERERDYLPNEAYTQEIKKVKGAIKFENVSFSYNEGSKILDGASFEIKAGERVALIGPNGSGKSTIINLLQRMYDPANGRILIDGVDINCIKLKEYRSLIACVNQNTYIFNGSIKDNITMFTDEDTLMMDKAAQAAYIYDFIKNAQNKYDAKVGKNGMMLSGGQRQKIAIARAFYKDSQILIFDEALSNCDLESESKIIDAIKKSYNKTIIFITHNMAVLKNMDRILYLENGYIKEIKPIEDLVSRTDNALKAIGKDETA